MTAIRTFAVFAAISISFGAIGWRHTGGIWDPPDLAGILAGILADVAGIVAAVIEVCDAAD